MWKCCPCFAKTYEAPEVLELDYRHSSLAQVPPDIFTFERTLEKLDLGSNQISDLPPSLFHCHELRELDLCDNDLMSIPPAVGSLTRLAKLDLSRNAITEISDTIKNCKSLTYFDLSMNHLSKLPEGISQLVNLEELFLNDTYLEFLHANFGRLTKLKVLELRENALQTLPKSMSRLHHIHRLDIGQNDLQELPEVIGTMSSLGELWCDNNNIRSIPKFIGNLSKLQCLDASQNEIQKVAEEISKCSQLSDVTLNINNIEVLPNSFTKLEHLSVLRLDSNSLTKLPEAFGNLRNLQEVSIVSNTLKSLPASIGLLRKVHTMYLDDNLIAALPKEIGSCSSLSVLSLAKNRLREIPSEIGHLVSLKVFTLSGNMLTNLPVSILNIPSLGALWLSESQSKPLLQMNKEIDPSSGQNVLTCYLLPQLTFGSNGEIMKRPEEPAKVPRRNKPSIKFMTDLETTNVIVEASSSQVAKRGLLRAPTPYPKELRALAKHASHIRQSRECNGDLANTDEPEYEGDYPEETNLGDEKVEVLPVIMKPSTTNLGASSSSSPSVKLSETTFIYKPPPLSESVIGLPEVPVKSYQGQGSRPSTSTSGVSSPSFTLPDKNTRETYGSSPQVSDLARKSPPPYHVAARRAAFFRSSGGAGSGPGSSKIQQPAGPGVGPEGQGGHARGSPIIGRMFPLEGISNHNHNHNPPAPESATATALNSTYTISRADSVTSIEDDGILAAKEEDVGIGIGIDVDVDVDVEDTTSLVKTIESALESVDKRTTEFLKDDKWEDNDSQEGGLTLTKAEEALEDQTDSISTSTTDIPKGPLHKDPLPNSISKIPMLGNKNSLSSETASNIPSLSSRIPKLPSLTSSFPTKPPTPNKPEFLGPKPKLSKIPTSPFTTATATATPSPQKVFTSPPPQKNINTPEENINSPFKRAGSGSRIPKFNTNSETLRSPEPSNANSTANSNQDNNNDDANLQPQMMTRIPSLGKKPWIFGTHKNARVVALEFRKINALGFSISDASQAGMSVDGQGIYIIGTDSSDSSVKVGDKILQIDGIDVSNMGVEIVKKILSNCQENIHLLVSRHS